MTDSSPAPTCPECGTRLPDGSPADLCPSCLMRQALASRTLPGGSAPPPSTPPPSPAEIADKFPQFEVTECLGRGGMGVVYKARQKSLDRWVAIKILAPERVGEEQFAERFAREAQTLACLSHPNIVTVFDYGETDGLYYIVMEFVDGVNLRDLLREGNLEPQLALSIVPPVCEALQYAHDKGIVHRDIKPENLLLDRDGRIKIADFGIAALVGATGERSGTPPYMAPEQGEPTTEIDHRADIYALGAVLYETLTGERPGSPLELPSHKVQVDIRIDDIVLRALNKEPERRYRNADEFRTMVETVSTAPTPPPPPSGPATPDSPPAAPPSRKSLDSRWIRIPAILMMILGTANIVVTALLLLVLPIVGTHLFNLAFGGSQLTRPDNGWSSGGSLGLIEIIIVVLISLLGLIPSILAIIGGRHMLRNSSFAWSAAGAGACCLIPLGWPLGLLIGVFALVILLLDRERIRETASPGEAPGTPPAKTADTGPKLSGLAVTGAVLQLLPMALIALSLGLSVILNATTGGAAGGINVGRSGVGALALVLLPFVALSVPGCILGWIAAGRIRASRGRLRGMGLAVFAAMTPVLLLSGALLLGAGITVLHLLVAADPRQPDRLTLMLSGILVALTALFLLMLIFGACLRHLKGTPASSRHKAIGIIALALLTLWLALGGLFWLQRPRLVDQGVTSRPGDHHYAATASTWHRRRVFGDDLLSYRFVVQERSGRVGAQREIPVPVTLLAADHLAVETPKHHHFNNNGNIRSTPSRAGAGSPRRMPRI